MQFRTKEDVLQHQKYLRIGDIVEDFHAKTTKGPLSLYDYMNSTGCELLLLLSHPRAQTPVCSTELMKVQKMEAEWKKRGIAVLALSVDTHEDNMKWIEEDLGPMCNTKDLFFPIINDDYTLATKLGMINPDHLDSKNMPLTARTVFVIDKSHKIRALITYPASTGRNMNEVLRLCDSILTTDKHEVATGENWCVGDKCIVLPNHTTEQAKQKFKNVETVRSYLRYVNPVQQ